MMSECGQRAETRKNLRSLLFYMLCVIVICLSAFNCYLFGWLWSSLSGDARLSLRSANNWAKLDLVSSWHKIKFLGALTNHQAFQVNELRASGGAQLRLESSSAIEFASDGRKLLELRARENRIHFPAGLKVRDALGEELLRCNADSSSEEASCELRAPLVELSHAAGLDFGRKTLETSKINTKRLHSATNALHLLANEQANFRSKRDAHLLALEDLTLSSRNSTVNLLASRVDISGVGGLASESTRASGGHKLCICLPERRQPAHETPLSNFDGLVFAIRGELDCLKFDAFCNGAQ